MDILVLDTIHGGREIALYLEALGHRVEAVDVYRGAGEATRPEYDRIVAPVHLDPDHPLLSRASGDVISHHEAVAWILEGRVPRPMVEITGARGKTTTACALAHCLPGPGILHTSIGTFRYPERTLLWKRSITPASVLPAALAAHELGGWLVAEESLGVSGAGDLAILTSDRDYPVGAGKKSGLAEKRRLVGRAPRVILPPGIPSERVEEIPVERMVGAEDGIGRFAWEGKAGIFDQALLGLEAYRVPLRQAAAAALLLGIEPTPLATFPGVPGRMSVEREAGRVVVDNANSGTDRVTTREAAGYARRLAGTEELTLVIGEEDRTICEGFSPEEVERTLAEIRPDRVILVGERMAELGERRGYPVVATLAEGADRARETPAGAIVLAVKTWR